MCDVVLRVVENPKYVNGEKLTNLTPDEKECLSVLSELVKETCVFDIHYYPEVFPEKENIYSKFVCNLGGDFEIIVYFMNGVYDYWSLKNIHGNENSGDKDRDKKEKAMNKIRMIIQNYFQYWEAKYQITRYINN